MDTTKNFHFTAGTLECIAVSDGTEVVPATSVVKDVPAEQWSQALLDGGYSPTESVVYFNCLTIRSGRQRVLVDAGWGRGTQRRDGALLDRLKSEGIAPDDVDFIVITHGDGDHIGGITTADGQLVFPNASYILSQEAWDFWSNTAVVARWPEFLTVFGRKTLPLIRDRVEVVAPGSEFLPGFRLVPAPGHRPGHTLLAVTSCGEYLLHLADLVGHPLLMEHPTWTWQFDYKPDQVEKDKAQLLGQAAAQHATVFGSHLPFPGVGRITAQGEGWRWQPLAGAAL
jgi:glyoxylase-like metal-dependent hydrolase (beta-lactamase superfamily II)